MWSVDGESPVPLQEQIAARVRRGVADGELKPGERLPAAIELADVLGVSPNTVLASFRRLRREGILDFSRGRGVRVAPGSERASLVVQAARELIVLGREHGYDAGELAELLVELARPMA
ncbi:GntR family transcriptional regulator [Amycolatopsis japonica]|uniref:GntR family transcriptional regulator n=1 Tax=Amycolatopsis japonica TaxID=208439 RepID=UPI0033D477CA